MMSRRANRAAIAVGAEIDTIRPTIDMARVRSSPDLKITSRFRRPGPVIIVLIAEENVGPWFFASVARVVIFATFTLYGLCRRGPAPTVQVSHRLYGWRP